ncbi:MAG: hypothetical protein P8J87_17405 [Verrucomicrobiales bacterium]|nr:hypothetical protein [Verrucomicrobiales bacterium]
MAPLKGSERGRKGVEEPEEPEEPEEADEVKVAVNEEVKKESEEAFDPSGECLTEDAGVVGENPGLEDVVVSVEVETEVRIEAEENSADGVDIADEMAAVEEKIEAIAAAMGITEAPEAVGEAVSVEQPEALAEALGDDDAGGDEIEVDGDSDRQRGEVASDGREEVAGAREEDVADEIADISAEVTDQKSDYFVSSGEVTREVDEEGIGEVVGEVDEEVVGGVDGEVYDRDEAPTGAGVIDDPVLAETEEESAAEVVYEPYTPSADYGKPVEEAPVESFQNEDPVIEEVDEPALAMAADSGHVDPATAAAVGPRVGLVEPKPSDPSGQGMLELDPGSRGRFDNSSPTVIDGEDLDVPTFLRKRKEK